MLNQLSHLDQDGNVKMVDVTDKPDSLRVAIAKGEVCMLPRTLNMIREGAIKKGDVLTTAKLAGIMAAKRASELIPLCHPILLSFMDIKLELDDDLPGVRIIASVQTTGKTGVEIEALTAVSISALTIYDMAKSVEKTMTIQNIRLVEKHGGVSGDVVNE